MNKVEKEIYSKIYDEVGKEVGLPASVVKGAYEGYWKFAKDYIQHLELASETLTDEEFLDMKPSINFPSLGKLAYPFAKFKAIKNRTNIIKHLNKDGNQSN